MDAWRAAEREGVSSCAGGSAGRRACSSQGAQQAFGRVSVKQLELLRRGRESGRGANRAAIDSDLLRLPSSSVNDSGLIFGGLVSSVVKVGSESSEKEKKSAYPDTENASVKMELRMSKFPVYKMPPVLQKKLHFPEVCFELEDEVLRTAEVPQDEPVPMSQSSVSSFMTFDTIDDPMEIEDDHHHHPSVQQQVLPSAPPKNEEKVSFVVKKSPVERVKSLLTALDERRKAQGVPEVIVLDHDENESEEVLEEEVVYKKAVDGNGDGDADADDETKEEEEQKNDEEEEEEKKEEDDEEDKEQGEQLNSRLDDVPHVEEEEVQEEIIDTKEKSKSKLMLPAKKRFISPNKRRFEFDEDAQDATPKKKRLPLLFGKQKPEASLDSDASEECEEESQEEKESLKVEIGHLKSTILSLQETVGKIREEKLQRVNDLQDSVNKFELKISSLLSEKETTKAETSRLCGELSELRGQLSEAKQSHVETQAQARKLAEIAQKEKADREQIALIARQMSGQLAGAENEAHRLQSRLQEESHRRNELERQSDTVRNMVKVASAQTERWRTHISKILDKLDMSLLHIDERRDQVQRVLRLQREQKQRMEREKLRLSLQHCVVCMTDPIAMCCIPCGHRCLCPTCDSRVSACPVCRTPIRERVRIFDAGV